MIVLLLQVVSKLPDVEKVVVIPFVHRQEDIDLSSLGSAPAVFLEDFLLSGLEEDGTLPPLQYEQVTFHRWNKKKFRKMHRVRQSAKLFLQSSELGLPQPLTPRRVCPPLGPGGEGHTRLRGGRRVPIPTKGTYTVVLNIFLCTCRKMVPKIQFILSDE
jgi:hypothetical protein